MQTPFPSDDFTSAFEQAAAAAWKRATTPPSRGDTFAAFKVVIALTDANVDALINRVPLADPFDAIERIRKRIQCQLPGIHVAYDDDNPLADTPLITVVPLPVAPDTPLDPGTFADVRLPWMQAMTAPAANDDDEDDDDADALRVFTPLAASIVTKRRRNARRVAAELARSGFADNGTLRSLYARLAALAIERIAWDAVVEVLDTLEASPHTV